MAITVKVLDRPVEQVSYVRATLRGMATTLGHLLNREKRHEVVTAYPEEKWELSPRWRGTHRMLTREDGKAKCVACGLCPTVCPANCIKLVPGEDEEDLCDHGCACMLCDLYVRRKARKCCSPSRDALWAWSPSRSSRVMRASSESLRASRSSASPSAHAG